MTYPRPTITGDPDDPLAYLEEFAAGEISHNPDKLAQAYLNLAKQANGREQQVYHALAWAIGATRAERRVHAKLRALEERVRSLEERLGADAGRHRRSA